MFNLLLLVLGQFVASCAPSCTLPRMMIGVSYHKDAKQLYQKLAQLVEIPQLICTTCHKYGSPSDKCPRGGHRIRKSKAGQLHQPRIKNQNAETAERLWMRRRWT
ncbi:hypothetical protein EV702DRAFT_1270923 [Suillus placidus]|uniref:Secreted protein n=1 Tax=Suillus placidus TaxID=48579 RepID=A0A9P6ZMC6_9AGAM|nr:hypothetical protein EV702DRAFT_1270923 [Suillus placidus]